MKNIKRLLITSLLSLSAITAIVSTATSLASFIALTRVGENLEVPSQGVKGEYRTIYLNANIWDTDSATYYMERIDSTGTEDPLKVPVSKVIHPTINSTGYTLYCFVYDLSDTHNKFVFHRINGSNVDGKPSTNYMIKVFNPTAIDLSLYAHPTTDGHFVARHVEFHGGETFQGYKTDDTYYKNNTLVTSNNECSVVSDGYGGNKIQVNTPGTYSIDFEPRDGGNCTIKVENEHWNNSQQIDYEDNEDFNYYCPNDSSNWNKVSKSTLNKEKVGEIYNWSFDTATVTFNVPSITQDGQSYYVVGDFNDWTPDMDYKLDYSNGNWVSGQNFPVLPKGNEFKLVIAPTINPSKSNIQRWQAGNNSVVAGDASITNVNWQ